MKTCCKVYQEIAEKGLFSTDPRYGSPHNEADFVLNKIYFFLIDPYGKVLRTKMSSIADGGNNTTAQEIFCSQGINESHQKASLSAFNIVTSIIAFLGNFVIIIALEKVSSLHLASKRLFQSLASTDLCVGFITQPLYIYSTSMPPWPSDSAGCFYTLTYSGFPLRVTGVAFCLVSLLTTTAISVHGQTAGFICGDKVQKGCDFNAGTFLHCSFLAFFFSHWIVIIQVLQVKCNYYLKLHYSSTVCGYLDNLLHENLSQASQSPSSCTDSAEANGRESNSNKRSTLQKDSVQCIVGPMDIIRLLSSIWYINS